MSKVKLKAPEGVTSASWEGVEYPVGKNGVVEVPSESLLTLYGFGFGNVPEDEKPAKAQKVAE